MMKRSILFRDSSTIIFYVSFKEGMLALALRLHVSSHSVSAFSLLMNVFLSETQALTAHTALPLKDMLLKFSHL